MPLWVSWQGWSSNLEKESKQSFLSTSCLSTWIGKKFFLGIKWLEGGRRSVHLMGRVKEMSLVLRTLPHPFMHYEWGKVNFLLCQCKPHQPTNQPTNQPTTDHRTNRKEKVPICSLLLFFGSFPDVPCHINNNSHTFYFLYLFSPDGSGGGGRSRSRGENQSPTEPLLLRSTIFSFSFTNFSLNGIWL